ncbi:energy-coupling factor ABC transporter ATP-binding protein [Rhodococcus sp. CH91]|uniref:energy-coupling factor ABC transporter ATP-binding protein n=1 Tax=Rhodococcus sp. CH91 TaxID=2910256 RepID=UPI001F4A6F61|nr:ABC transporter ATP-binding protein [Rhodococcus sp. CH91]
MSGPASVELSAVRYVYPDGRHALRGIDLHVPAGERVAVLGPNGSGKTTLMLHLNGVLSPTSGSVRIDGTVVDRSTVREIRSRVGLVFQDPDDQLFMPTVTQDVAFGPANFGVSEPELGHRVRSALDAVAMTEHADRTTMHLSAGQRRRVALATALSCLPGVLVLDEPSNDLDPVSRRELAEVLLRLTATMLVVTHDLPYAAQLCSRAVILDEGRVVADGPISTILADSELLARHRLELPWGFTPASTTPR